MCSVLLPFALCICKKKKRKKRKKRKERGKQKLETQATGINGKADAVSDETARMSGRSLIHARS